MADTRIAPISGVGRPSYRLRRMAEVLHGNKMADAVETMIFDAKAVNALAEAMDQALLASTNLSGNVDMKDAALHLIQWMRRNQR